METPDGEPVIDSIEDSTETGLNWSQPGFVDDDEDNEKRRLQQTLDLEVLRADIASRQALTDQLEAQTAYLNAEKVLKEGEKPNRQLFMKIVGGAAVAQLILANVVFLLYAAAGMHWQLPVAAISAWLGATMIQIVAVLLVVANNLFPRRENPPVAGALLRSTPLSDRPETPASPAQTDLRDGQA